MPRYSVELVQSQWIISVGGAQVLTCKNKKAALKAVRRAAVLLHQGEPPDFPSVPALTAASGRALDGP
jgi:hypothetical protein